MQFRFRFLTWRRSSRAAQRPRRWPTAWIWRAMPRGWAITATGWRASQYARHRQRCYQCGDRPCRGGTSRIRVGAGGIMLPNHAPLVIAEQFGTLAALYPGRIDLGVGRAPAPTSVPPWPCAVPWKAISRIFPTMLWNDRSSGRHPVRPSGTGHSRQRQPCAGVDSRLQSLWCAAGGGAGPALRLRLAFRRSSWMRPSRYIARISGVRGTCQTLCDAGPECLCRGQRRAGAAPVHFLQQAFINLRTGSPAPAAAGERRRALSYRSAHQAECWDSALSCAIVGAPDTVKTGLAAFIARHQPDELMVTAQIYDHTARKHSFELLSRAATTGEPALRLEIIFVARLNPESIIPFILVADRAMTRNSAGLCSFDRVWCASRNRAAWCARSGPAKIETLVSRQAIQYRRRLAVQRNVNRPSARWRCRIVAIFSPSVFLPITCRPGNGS